jgi:hypothetical protein
MHRKTRLARLKANVGQGRGSKDMAWGRSAV